MALDDYPVDFSAHEVRTLLAVLAETYYRTDDIVRVLQGSGVPVHEVKLDGSSLAVWRSALDVSVGRARLDALLTTVTSDRPALKPRLDELRAASSTASSMQEPPPEANVEYTSSTWKNFSDDGVAEAIIVAGQPTFVDVSFLSVGVEKARSVCRLATRFPGEGSGTAFRVGARRLLTNHHVLFDHTSGDRPASSVEAWFDYQTGADGKLASVTQIPCVPDSIVGEKNDDWAVIETESDIPDRYPVLPLATSTVPRVDDRVYIIQHPYGLPKKVAFQHNLVRAVMDDRFQYWTDTDLGSSGSPVFDERWQVVGLHHFSVKAPASDRISVRNQGRRIDRVAARMDALGVGAATV